MSIAEKLKTITENQQKVYNAGLEAGEAAGGKPVIKPLTVTENGIYTASMDVDVDGFSPVTVNVSVLDTGDATATAADIDYEKTAYADGVKIIGTKQRKEYHDTIKSEVKGNTADDFVVLCEDDLLAEIRTLDTLFVRVECDIEPAPYTIAKNWASNRAGEVFPVAQTQLVYRYGSNGSRSFATLDKALNEDYVSGVGALHITESGKLLFYSGSPNYAIRPCAFKVIVEWQVKSD